ncbi:hypothetical protein SAMN02745126_00378 [Enhydrobacter aerosaccus]|uniref:Uncharacterized protein n=1 Tax=Enhydrobacter aerosaccus TaxID=225324 RepID=A0A1T4JRF5_9HYPH|nr:pyridoxamine 5'-phosphate oxidase family protein [Enhydrobacter aerosaccus]SJZ32723.1 hypothetical protein SAMN02745126_00378 [Enhydrobacter aerosaccus]
MSPFHADELAAQSLSGQSVPGAPIRPFLPEQHRDFFRLLPYLFVTSTDRTGWPVASMIQGSPGFVHSPDPTTLRIDALPTLNDPVVAGLEEGRDIGLLGLDLSTRRRNRANGQIARRDMGGLTVAVRQSFGNCAQYIQLRTPSVHPRHPTPIQPLNGLDAASRELIAKADTFFVASRSRPEIHQSGGLDVSHRGGQPGFVDIQGDTLIIPDFRGNRYFNTLGNLLGDPRAGLLFIDFATGELLQLQGIASIDWTGPVPSMLSGAERVWRVRIERGWRQAQALSFDWSFGGYAPTTLRTGTWRTTN